MQNISEWDSNEVCHFRHLKSLQKFFSFKKKKTFWKQQTKDLKWFQKGSNKNK